MPRLQRALRDTLGGLPRVYWWLWTGTLVNRIGAFVVPFLAIYLTSGLHRSVSYAGLVLALLGLGGTAASLAGGVLADRIGRRPTLLGAQLGTAVSLVGLGLVHGQAAVAGWALLYGFFANATRPAFSATMTDVVAPQDRVRACSLNYWAINLGFAIAPVLAGFLAQVSYLLLFLGDALTTLALAGIVFLRVPETHPHLDRRAEVGAASGPRPPAGSTLDAVRDPVFMAFTGLAFLLALVFMQLSSTLPVAMAADGLSPAQYGTAVSANGLLIVLLTVPATVWLSRFARSRVLAVAALLLGGGFALTAAASTWGAYVGTVVVWTLGEILNAPVSSAVVADLAPAHARGRYQGVYSFAWGAASFLAPLLGAWVYDALGGTVLWLACGVIGVVVAVGQLVVAPARGRRLSALRALAVEASTSPA
ncbi:MAG: MDR family MFS transporter [Motilibacteraceae bacterium]